MSLASAVVGNEQIAVGENVHWKCVPIYIANIDVRNSMAEGGLDLTASGNDAVVRDWACGVSNVSNARYSWEDEFRPRRH